MAVDPLAHLAGHLAQLESDGLRRHARPATRPGTLSFCSNDYLGLASRAAPPVASGSGASRLIAGERDEHRRLERAFATWLGVEDMLAFSSGYAANVGAVSALANAGDLIVSDALNHASLIDGARLSRARVAVVSHGDQAAVERALASRSEARAWVVVESYYSMDADGPDLSALRALCDAHGAALYVDEAHALGVLGPSGRGRCAEAGVTPDVLVGTLGKAFGSQGAFVAGRTVVREWLWNRARSFVFSTGLAPVSAAVGVRALQEVIEHPELADRVRDLAARLRAGLIAAGAVELPTLPGTAEGEIAPPRLLGFGHVVPVVLGTPTRALRWAAWMRERGVDVHAIRPPTVPAGASRIRMTVTAEHREEDVDRAIDAFASAARADAGAPVEP
ncbi:MAG: 8-amino-7-oxononanoate synthase [Myxococcaceae bacterium]|nr:8-amino-7-oxononanoate synthase [Myxococcaceae bacterium]